jgi:hypothetical protein
MRCLGKELEEKVIVVELANLEQVGIGSVGA